MVTAGAVVVLFMEQPSFDDDVAPTPLDRATLNILLLPRFSVIARSFTSSSDGARRR